MNPPDNNVIKPDNQAQPAQASVVSSQSSASPPSPTIFSYNETNARHNRARHRLILSAVAIVLLLIAGSSAMITNTDKNQSVSKSQASSSAVSHAAAPQSTEQQASVSEAAATEPQLDQHPAYPDDVRAAFIAQCVSYKNKESTCTCNINFIQQRYTLEEYTTISQNPESRQYEDMVAAAYDNNDCV